LAKIYAREHAAEAQIQKTPSKASRLRTEFLNSFDELSSHLDTTFPSLSDALAKSNNFKMSVSSTVFFMIIVGPSVTTPRARVIMGIDGLRVKLWGVPDDDSDLDTDSSGEFESEAEDEDEDQYGDETRDAIPQVPLPSPDAARLLSRLLSVTPDALSLVELQPTQIHILIRAPRRLSHPSWIAKQQLSKALDKVVDMFCNGEEVKNVEGVWVRAKDIDREEVKKDETDDCQSSEDELIWWSWDGKLVGFTG
jgi:hypothetical protein